MLNDHSLTRPLSTTSTLTSLPHILIKLLSICNNGVIDIKKATGIIQLDPALCCKVLSLVPTGYSQRSHKIRSIEQAVMRAGAHAISNIAITAAVQEATHLCEPKKMFQQKIFWRHALETAVVSGTIALRTGYQLQDEAFLAGLLHDIGKLFPPAPPSETSAVYRMKQGPVDIMFDDEMSLYESHARLGADLLSHWNIHDFIVDAVRYHHESEDRIKSALPLVQIVHTANLLSGQAKGDGEKGRNIAERLFSLKPDDVDNMMVMCRRKVEAVILSLDIVIDPLKEKPDTLSSIDRKKINSLSQKVREYALMAGTMHSLMKAKGRTDFMNAVHQGLKTVFNIGNLIYFLYNRKNPSALKGTIPTDSGDFLGIEDLTIPLNAENSIIIQALKQGKILNSFQTTQTSELTVMDREIIDFMGGAGMLCLPILKHGESIGVIVMATDQMGLHTISCQNSLLQMLSDVSSMAMEARESTTEKQLMSQVDSSTRENAFTLKTRHEINNPLSIIKNYLKVLTHRLAENRIAQDELTIISEEIDRVSNIINRISTPEDDPALMNRENKTEINQLLSDLAKLLKDSLARQSNIVLTLDLDPSTPIIRADKDLLKQVFINIIKNGIEAMPKGGRLTIQSRIIRTDPQNILDDRASQQDCIQVNVIDEGDGICETVKHRLFEPNISTKENGHTGLGLSIAHNLIKTIGGDIRIGSAEQTGTQVIIELPLGENKNALKSECTHVVTN